LDGDEPPANDPLQRQAARKTSRYVCDGIVDKKQDQAYIPRERLRHILEGNVMASTDHGDRGEFYASPSTPRQIARSHRRWQYFRENWLLFVLGGPGLICLQIAGIQFSTGWPAARITSTSG